MKEFSQQRIEKTKAIFEEKKFPVEKTRLGNLDVSYWVIPQAVNPNLPDFSLRMTNTNPETREVSGIFGVSDSVPTELRPYWAAHEIIEFTEMGIRTKGRCVISEQKTLNLVPKELTEQYIARRTKFFTNLISYFRDEMKRDPDSYTKGDLGETKATLSYLTEKTESRLKTDLPLYFESRIPELRQAIGEAEAEKLDFKNRWIPYKFFAQLDGIGSPRTLSRKIKTYEERIDGYLYAAEMAQKGDYEPAKIALIADFMRNSYSGEFTGRVVVEAFHVPKSAVDEYVTSANKILDMLFLIDPEAARYESINFGNFGLFGATPPDLIQRPTSDNNP